MKHLECVEKGCANKAFAQNLCRKHYEKERLATAAPCSFSGCSSLSYRGNLCARHYRENLKKLRPVCVVEGCPDPQHTLKSGLCAKHAFRLEKHGSVAPPRPNDWGARENHPLYNTYHWHRRKFSGMCDEWKLDFWSFVNAVSPKPEGWTLKRLDKNLPLGPGNWYWNQPTSNKDKPLYQRIWRKKNPVQAKNHELKRKYNIDYLTYARMEQEQNNACAICGKAELSLDKNGLPRKMPVDHCHATGKVRGLLCTPCNRALGLFKDSPDILRKAALYVEKSLDTTQNQA